jgi:hypothetical protein
MTPDRPAATHGRPNQWSVAIFSSREDVTTLSASIDAVRTAASGRGIVIDVMINGNADLADETTACVSAHASASDVADTIRVWSVPLADKANAWNQYLHHVWPRSEVTFFVDGYASVHADALKRLADGLRSSGRALAAAAVPSVGRSAAALRARMLKEPQINGSLYALRGETMDALRGGGFRMPLGLYQQDGLLGSVLAFGLDPSAHAWTPEHIAVVPSASWSRRVESIWNRRDLATNVDRMMRQALGSFEALAIRDHLVHRKLAPSALPETNVEFLSSWIRHHTSEALTAIGREPLALPALVRLRRNGVPKQMRPTLMGTIGRA